jgi:cyclopropane fatty-acyl-phospholipid synthase-like methyltransferase
MVYNKKTVKYFSNKFNVSSSGFSNEMIILRQLLLNKNEFIKFAPFSNKKILDLGCGYGYLSYRLAKKFPKSYIIGIDVDISRINTANRNYKLPNLEFLVADAYTFNIKKKFDIILAIDLFHHVSLENHDKILLKVREHLVENGIFIIRDINKNSTFKPLNTLHDIIINKFFHPSYRSFLEWKIILNKFDFRIRKITHFNKFIYPYIYIISNIKNE